MSVGPSQCERTTPVTLPWGGESFYHPFPCDKCEERREAARAEAPDARFRVEPDTTFPGITWLVPA